MKKLISLVVLSLLICTALQAQKKTFLRFYDPSGRKFEKSQFITSTDSSIVVFRDSALIEIPISRINFIKTKRSYGNHALISSLIIGIPLTIYAISTGEPKPNDDIISFTPGEAAFLGVLGGMVGGAITGAIFSGKSQTLVIDGNIENWRQFESGIAKTPLPK